MQENRRPPVGILIRNGETISQACLQTPHSAADSRTRDLHMINNHRSANVIGVNVIAISVFGWPPFFLPSLIAHC